jgi:hypothetical protein
MKIAEYITRCYGDRALSENQAEWANSNPNASATLTIAHQLAKDYGLIED